MAKRYEATQETLANASYEVRLINNKIVVSNISGINEGLYAKIGKTPVTIMGQDYNLDVPNDITSIEVAAEEIKSILYVLNLPTSDAPDGEAINNAKNIAGVADKGLTFEQLTPITIPAAN